ncbi:lauroyl acyltransferase [soil metagenome]
MRRYFARVLAAVENNAYNARVNGWKELRYRLEWFGVMLLLKLVPLLSRQACYNFAGWAGSLAFTFDRRGQRVAMSNLTAAFGDELTGARRVEIARESYRHFARTMLDLFWSPRLTSETYRDYIEFEGVERSKAEIAPTNSCIVGAFHYGNFEWFSLASAWLGFPSAIVAQEFKNPLLDDLFRRLREQSGHTMVEREGAIIRLYKVLRRKGRVALLVDTTLPPHEPTVVIECFGMKTIVTVAHGWLAERTGAPIIPVYCEPLPGGRYRVVTHPKIQLPHGATHQEIVQACWDSFEPVVRRNPAPWLWMYRHWRYKPAGAEGYPSYAQESWAFDQIAARPNYSKLDRSEAPENRTAA